jgi:hypothetical protein
MAEKSLVNDVAEMLAAGAPPDVDVLADDDVDELELELPHPATNRPTATTSVNARARLRVAFGTFFDFTTPPLVNWAFPSKPADRFTNAV